MQMNRSIKNSKTPKVDEIPIELIKLEGRLLQENILKFLNHFYSEGAVPKEWCKIVKIEGFLS